MKYRRTVENKTLARVKNSFTLAKTNEYPVLFFLPQPKTVCAPEKKANKNTGGLNSSPEQPSPQAFKPRMKATKRVR